MKREDHYFIINGLFVDVMMHFLTSDALKQDVLQNTPRTA
jgi:hypothetical protein